MTPLSFNKVCLASQSPRRRQLLEQIGVEFDVQPADIDESVHNGELPQQYVERVTKAKASAIWSSPNYGRNYPVMASDTAVVVDQKILGKPQTRADGLDMLALLSGRSHQVVSGVGLLYQDRFGYRSSVTDVHFRTLTEADMHNYWSTGEGLDKAGCYGIQGLAASFIDNITGSFSGVMGLPLYETSELLTEFSVHFWLNRPTA
ncbi:Maf family protein [Pleionea mediterranea]|uniref:dTTP/UTP pyrophosphatase n=1 Tax=Pleionea mediterranea TaxID=523701 RepID=A0A316G0E7_9GAMM|nr:Maf family protein [Pleionea mediterranea]PWK47817.1 septum formation protein [Pleionea mediterranea]